MQIDISTYEKEREKLEKISPLTLIDYIKSSIDILVGNRADELIKEKINKTKNEKTEIPDSNKSNNTDISNFSDIDDDIDQTETSANQYEKLLRKHEEDIRNFIKVNI